MSAWREELVWYCQHPVVATRWWFRRLVIARLNGEHKAARAYEERMMLRMTPEEIERSRQAARDANLPRRIVRIKREEETGDDSEND